MTAPRVPGARVDPLSESANRQQAEHLREMLLAQCEELDADLATYGSALERYQRRGEQTQARRIRGMIRAAERERHAVQDLIAGLEKRFLTAVTRAEALRHPQPATGARHGMCGCTPTRARTGSSGPDVRTARRPS